MVEKLSERAILFLCISVSTWYLGDAIMIYFRRWRNRFNESKNLPSKNISPNFGCDERFYVGSTESWFFPAYCFFCLKKQILIFVWSLSLCYTMVGLWIYCPKILCIQKIAEIGYFTIKNITNTHKKFLLNCESWQIFALISLLNVYCPTKPMLIDTLQNLYDR